MVIAPTKKSRFAAEGHARQNRHRHDRLELRQHEERSASCHIQRNEHGNEHQLPRLRLSALENQEERQHTFEQNEQRNEVIFSPREIVYADKQRQRNEQQNQQPWQSSVRFRSFRFSTRRLDQIIRPVCFAADGQRKHKQARQAECRRASAGRLPAPSCRPRRSAL